MVVTNRSKALGEDVFWDILLEVLFLMAQQQASKGCRSRASQRVLWSLRIEYDACGQSFQSVPHGEPPHDVKDLQEDEVSFTCVSQGFFGLFI